MQRRLNPFPPYCVKQVYLSSKLTKGRNMISIRIAWRVASLSIFAVIAVGCGGGSGNSGVTPVQLGNEQPPGNGNVEPITPVDPSNNAPEIDLLGEKVVRVSLNNRYIDDGFVATDIQDGDLTGSVETFGEVNTAVAGDYLLRHRVTDSSGAIAEGVRIIRVLDDRLPSQVHRSASVTASNLSYLEYLPESYGSPQNENPPLIIFNHGSGATGAGTLAAVECCGLPLVIRQSDWDSSLPFIILSPQRTSGLDTQALNEFVDYAVETYDVDTRRIYMAGWSQGANVSLRYSTDYPDKIVAIAALAGGLFQGIPSNICLAEDTPLWTFLGDQDTSIVNRAGLNTTEAFNACNPSIPARLTTYIGASHFDTSNLPFQPNAGQQITNTSDPLDVSVFDWFLFYQN